MVIGSDIIKLEIRRNLKKFGKGDLIRLGFYRINKYSFAREDLIELGYL